MRGARIAASTLRRMHIILDSNVYAADYRMSGVSFRTLFEYIRRTESSLVLPRLVREEVVVDYGRRLKAEAKAFEDVWNKYRHVDPGGHRERFQKPNLKHAMVDLRRRLMKPTDAVAPIYVGETTGVSVDEVFMRGVRRTRPANEQGEELRDVVIWLWAIAYSNSLLSPTAFISNDSAFWTKEGVHPDIQRDLLGSPLMSIYRSIDDFAKQHAPAPTPATPEWLSSHFHIQAVEGQLIDRAARELAEIGATRDLTLGRYSLTGGEVYDVAPQTQFAELQFDLVFKFVFLGGRERPFDRSFYGTPSLPLTPLGMGGGYLANVNRMLTPTDLQPDDASFLNWTATAKAAPQSRELQCDAKTKISVRIRGSEPSEASIDRFSLDRMKLQLDLYRSRS
jgi:hypothetical protein